MPLIGVSQHVAVSEGQHMFPWYAALMLGFESGSVINKRLTRISLGGPRSLQEIRLMVAEKAEAAQAASFSLMFGCTMGGLVDQYRVLVAANEARLSA